MLAFGREATEGCGGRDAGNRAKSQNKVGDLSPLRHEAAQDDAGTDAQQPIYLQNRELL